MTAEGLAPTVRRFGNGRVLYITASGTIYTGRGYSLHRSDDWGRTWKLDGVVRVPPAMRWRLWSNLSRRLFRYMYQAMEILDDGTRLAVVRDGVYRAGPGEVEMVRSFRVSRGSRPLSLSKDGQGRIVWGEYGSNPQRHEMHLYASDDGGRSFSVCYTFPAGEIRHVHGVTYDPYIDRFWVFVGDYEQEPGIGVLDRSLNKIDWIARGKQEHRVVQAIIGPETLVYGTDSDVERNAILRMDKKSGKLTRLREVEGSSLYATVFGGVAVVSTCVEPSRVNRDRHAFLYASRDMATWEPVLKRPKDPLPMILQYGMFVLPRSYSREPRAVVSGQAISGLDDRMALLDFGRSNQGNRENPFGQ